MAKKISIDQQIKRLEEQRKILIQKKRKEQENQLKQIGKMVAKLSGGIENVSADLLKEALDKYYLPLLQEGSTNFEAPREE